MGSWVRSKSRMTEAKAAKERKEKDCRDIENEKKKEDRLKNERLETQKYLFEQMQAKAKVKEKAKEERKTLGSALEVDARKYFDKEDARISAQKQRAMEHRAELERQIAAKNAIPAKKDTMSNSELAMNRNLLERVERLQQADNLGSASCV